jgi:flagellar basal-body rod protein FlgB
MFAQLTGGLDFQANALLARAERQRVIASNIANADTPGYAARDVNCRDAMAAARGEGRLASGSRGAAPASHPGHIPVGRPGDGSIGTAGQPTYSVQSQPAMDNNSVDLDRERANFVDNAVRYETTLRFINGYSKTILSAIQGQ